jgi:uncharacterized lipoprotein NlpE involved in copper resistance
MKKMLLVFVAAFSFLGLGACGSTGRAIDAAHNSRNSLDWAGIYKGVIPAASGPGIDVEIVLRNDETYSISYQYIDRGDEVYTETGTFKWNKAGTTVTLDVKDMPSQYQVGENVLFQLDKKGKRITGLLEEHYILKRVWV